MSVTKLFTSDKTPFECFFMLFLCFCKYGNECSHFSSLPVVFSVFVTIGNDLLISRVSGCFLYFCKQLKGVISRVSN